MPRGTLFTAAGLIGTVVGAYVFVTGAERVIDALDSSGGFVGLTVVALGRRPRAGHCRAVGPPGPGHPSRRQRPGRRRLGRPGGTGVLADAGLTVVAAGLMVAVVLLSWAFLAGGLLLVATPSPFRS